MGLRVHQYTATRSPRTAAKPRKVTGRRGCRDARPVSSWLPLLALGSELIVPRSHVRACGCEVLAEVLLTLTL